jgi:flagellar hook-associated protein 1 FlgK
MSDMLSIGASGVRAYQTALTTVSENIANSGTAGYVRRSASVREVAAVNTNSINGLGAIVTGINRSADPVRNGAVRSAGADLARTDTSVNWMERIETGLTGNQLGTRITDFFNSARAVAADPSAAAPRAAMMESAASVAQSFAATGNALAAAMSDLDAGTDAAVNQLNGLTAALAKINNGIGSTTPGTSGAANLLDQRDQLLEQMSALTDVDVQLDSAGRATVRAGTGGPVLVQGATAGVVTSVRNDEGAMSFAVHRGGEAASFAPSGGALAGMAEGAQRIATAQGQLETLAADFANGVNDVQAQGRDLAGNPGEPMFEVGDPATKLTLTLGDPSGIAAASAGGSTRDNSNLAKLDTLRSGGGFENKVTGMVTTNASALSSRKLVSDAQGAIRDSAVSARASASGVNIDEEAVDLMRFQQAYQASSRVIQVARETLQSILDIG